MIYNLPRPIPSNYSYDAVRIEPPRYVPEDRCYVTEVFGVVSGVPCPLVLGNSAGLQHITECRITDAEINAVLADHPGMTDRMEAGLLRAMERLNALVQS